MSIEEKEMLYFMGKKIDNARNVLELIKSEMNNKNGSLSNEILTGAITNVIESLSNVSDEMIIE